MFQTTGAPQPHSAKRHKYSKPEYYSLVLYLRLFLSAQTVPTTSNTGFTGSWESQNFSSSPELKKIWPTHQKKRNSMPDARIIKVCAGPILLGT